MKRNYNQSGMTIIEVLVSVIIISFVMSLLFVLLLQVQNANSAAKKKSNLLISQAVITKAIEQDMIEIGVSAVSACTYEDFNMFSNQIDESEPYACARLEFNKSYDINDLGYIMVYKQNENAYDNATWVVKYARGYYDNCVMGNSPSDGSSWIESYSVVQKLNNDVTLGSFVDRVTGKTRYVSLNYSAEYDPTEKYSRQKVNSANIVIPIVDSNNYHYDIDLSFSFRLYYPDETDPAKAKQRVDFVCDDEGIDCVCTSSKDENCNKTYSSNLPGRTKSETDKTYNYTCTATKKSVSTSMGINKDFLTLSNVNKAGIVPDNVRKITFSNSLDSNGFGGYGIDVSLAQNKTSILYYEFDDNTDTYDIMIGQSGGVTVAGKSMANMFADCIRLESINFANFSSNGIEDMKNLFKNCEKLTNGGLQGFLNLNFDGVRKMSAMFKGCKRITVSPFRQSSGDAFNLSSLVDVFEMFSNSGLTEFIYYKDLWCDNVTSFLRLLSDSTIQTFVIGDVSRSVSMNHLNSMAHMLDNCNSLTTFKLINCSFPALNTIERICYHVSSSNVSVMSALGTYNSETHVYSGGGMQFVNLYTPNLENLSYAFYYEKINSSLNISNWTIVNNYNADHMFFGAGLTAFSFGDDTFGTEGYGGPYNGSYMFYNCSIKKLINNDTRVSALINANYMFYYNYLDTIEGGFYLPNVVDCTSMFSTAGPSYKAVFNYIKEGSLSKCVKFTNMFFATRYQVVYLDNINSEVTDAQLSCVNMFAAGSSNGKNTLKNVYMRNANFKARVSMTSMFAYNWSLRFVDFDYVNGAWDNNKYYDGTYTYYGMDTPDTSDDTNIDHIGNFENFFDKDSSTGLPGSMEKMFFNCSSLRGLPDNFFRAMNIKSVYNCNAMFEYAGIEAILGGIRNKFGVLLDFDFNSNPTLTYMFHGVDNFSYIKLPKLIKSTNLVDMFNNVGGNSDRITDLTIDLSSLTTNLDTFISTGFSGKGQVPIKIITKANQTVACSVYNTLKSKYPSVTVTYTDGVSVLDPTKC